MARIRLKMPKSIKVRTKVRTTVKSGGRTSTRTRTSMKNIPIKYKR